MTAALPDPPNEDVSEEERFWQSNPDSAPIPAGLEQWGVEQIKQLDRWRRVLNWGPHDKDDGPEIHPEAMEEQQQEMKKAIYATLWTLPPDKAEKLRRIIASAKPRKFDKRRRGHLARTADKLCDILEMDGETKAEKRQAYSDKHGLNEETVAKFMQRARNILGLSK